MSTETIYEHLKDVYQTAIESLVEPVTLIEPSDTVSKVINKITKNDVYDVFCLQGNRVLATNVRALLGGKDIVDMRITPFLSTIPTLSISDTVSKAANIITHYRTRHAPVLHNNKIVGTVSAKKILELISAKDNRWIKANLIFTKNPITITSEEPLSAARKIMNSKRIDHIPVIKKGSIQQVLTSFHLLQTLNPHEGMGRRAMGMNKIRNLNSKIGNLGSTRIPQCLPKDDLNSIIDAMLKTNTTCCLVILWDNLHGIITYRDILSLLTAKIESSIPLYIVGMPEDQENFDLITSKFTKALKQIRKVYSEIQEAKVSIKKLRSRKTKNYYEVSIRIITPYHTFLTKEDGWDLSQIFEILSQKLQRNLSRRAKRRFKTSIRKLGEPISPI